MQTALKKRSAGGVTCQTTAGPARIKLKPVPSGLAGVQGSHAVEPPGLPHTVAPPSRIQAAAGKSPRMPGYLIDGDGVLEEGTAGGLRGGHSKARLQQQRWVPGCPPPISGGALPA